MMAVNGTAETFGFENVPKHFPQHWATLDHGQTAREGILTTNYFFVADNVAVSYTHLDVYKRQVGLCNIIYGNLKKIYSHVQKKLQKIGSFTHANFPVIILLLMQKKCYSITGHSTCFWAIVMLCANVILNMH